jgi:hypothetical protein
VNIAIYRAPNPLKMEKWTSVLSYHLTSQIKLWNTIPKGGKPTLWLVGRNAI